MTRLAATFAAATVTAAAVLAGCGGSSAPAFSDSTTCQQFVGASQDRQNAYAKLYVKEYGWPANLFNDPGTVVADIDSGCTTAFDTGSGSNTTVVEAIQSPNGVPGSSNANAASGNTGSGNTGSGNTGSGNTGSGNTGSGNTGSGNTDSGNAGGENTASSSTTPSPSSATAPTATARACPQFGDMSVHATRNVTCTAAQSFVRDANSSHCGGQSSCQIDGFSCNTVSPIPGDVVGSFQTTCVSRSRKIVFGGGP